MDKELFMIDTAIEVDASLLAKIDGMIQKDKSIPKDEKELWDRVHLYPDTLTKKLIKWLEGEYENKRSKS